MTGAARFVLVRLLTRQFWMLYGICFVVVLLMGWRATVRDSIFRAAAQRGS